MKKGFRYKKDILESEQQLLKEVDYLKSIFWGRNSPKKFIGRLLLVLFGDRN